MNRLTRLLVGPSSSDGSELEVRNYADPFMSIDDPVVLARFGGGQSEAGVTVTERSAAGYPALYRAVNVIASTWAGLPQRRVDVDSNRIVGRTWADNPGRLAGMTAYSWGLLTGTYAVLYNETFHQIIRLGGGQVGGLVPIHPGTVTVTRLKDGTKRYDVRGADGLESKGLTDAEILHTVWFSLDGLRGEPLIRLMRQSISTGLAGERAAARTFRNGMHAGSLITADDDDLAEGDADVIKAEVMERGAGVDNAGTSLFVNRKLKLTPWTMTLADAQFLESRAFQVEEVTRMTGVPPHLLGQTDKQTSWGQGVGEQNRGLARYVLMGWTTGLDQSMSRLYDPMGTTGEHLESDYSGLLAATPKEEADLVIALVDAGLMSKADAAARLKLGPIPEAASVVEQDPAGV